MLKWLFPLYKALHKGKTYLACAFGNSTCRQGLKTKYYRVNRLLTDLAIGRGDGSYNQLMRELKKTDLLILDDWGMAVLDPVSGRDLLEVVEDRFWDTIPRLSPDNFPSKNGMNSLKTVQWLMLYSTGSFIMPTVSSFTVLQSVDPMILKSKIMTQLLQQLSNFC